MTNAVFDDYYLYIFTLMIYFIFFIIIISLPSYLPINPSIHPTTHRPYVHPPVQGTN